MDAPSSALGTISLMTFLSNSMFGLVAHFRCRRSHYGFTLTEMAVVLVILSLLMGYFLSGGAAFMDLQAVKQSQAKLKTIETALVGYVAVHGRLPCPADGRAITGVEYGSSGGCTGSQQYGVVPWSTIGLSEADSVDAWNYRITYRVGQYLWVDQGMNMASCDAAGTESVVATPKLCASGCASTSLASCTPPALFLQSGKGLDIKDAAASGNALMDTTTTPTGGAAFVLISHGKQGHGAYPRGSSSITPLAGSGVNESPNSNNVAVTFGSTFFVDMDYSESSGTNHFDDIVLRPSIMSVLLQAQRGPRTH